MFLALIFHIIYFSFVRSVGLVVSFELLQEMHKENCLLYSWSLCLHVSLRLLCIMVGHYSHYTPFIIGSLTGSSTSDPEMVSSSLCKILLDACTSLTVTISKKYFGLFVYVMLYLFIT